MAERVEVVDVNVNEEAVTVRLEPDNGGLVILHNNDCRILWDEFKTHTFRRDDPAGEKAHDIFIKIAKASGEYV